MSRRLSVAGNPILEFFFEANNVANDGMKKAIFISASKDDVYEIIRSLSTPLTPKDFTYTEIIEKLDSHFTPAPNEIVQRFNFHRRHQANGESIACFVKDLRKLSEFCNFTELENMLRDRIVCGVTDQSLQRRLFGEPNLTFQKAYDLAIAHETATQSVINIRGAAAAVDSQADVLRVAERQFMTQRKRCYRCGDDDHLANECRYKNRKCEYCKKPGHTAKACFKKRADDKKTDEIM